MFFRKSRIEGLGLIDLARAPGIETAIVSETSAESRKAAEQPPSPPIDASQGLFETLDAVRRDLERMRSGHTPERTTPVEDEWGIFDPARAGIAAALARLDEIAKEKARKSR